MTLDGCVLCRYNVDLRGSCVKQPARTDPSATLKQMFACVWVMPPLQFNKGEPECSLKHDYLISLVHFTLLIN